MDRRELLKELAGQRAYCQGRSPAYLSGSIRVGKHCWISPNCSIRQKLVIGDEAIVGIGAVVVRNVEPRSTVYGNPAKPAAAAVNHSPTGVVPVHHEK